MKNLFVISSPSGAGKTTLVSRLLTIKYTKIIRPVTHTTRGKRPGEVDGVHYHFRTRDLFEKMIKTGEFVEFAEVHGNLYGTSKGSIESVRPDYLAVLIVDCEGAASVRCQYPACTTIFISAPAASLRERLITRGTESMEAIERRLANAEAELARANEFDYVIENIDIDVAFRKLAKLIVHEQIDAHIESILKPAPVSKPECARIGGVIGFVKEDCR